jgi:hypothetical protein
VLKACRLYNVFGSGAIHGIYAQFLAQAAIHNKGRKIGLLRGSGTRFATWFYALMRILRLRDALLATVHQATFKDLAKTDVIRAAVVDIKDDQLFKAMYFVLRAVFPAIRALRFCDKGEPCLDKIYYLSKRATVAFDRSKELLNDPDLFKLEIDEQLKEYTDDVYGNTEYNKDEEE